MSYLIKINSDLCNMTELKVTQNVTKFYSGNNSGDSLTDHPASFSNNGKC